MGKSKNRKTEAYGEVRTYQEGEGDQPESEKQREAEAESQVWQLVGQGLRDILFWADGNVAEFPNSLWLFNKFLLSTCLVPGTVLDAGKIKWTRLLS